MNGQWKKHLDTILTTNYNFIFLVFTVPETTTTI